ncbi:MAG: sensor histidine kinase [Granulosicoccus sp.]
MRDSHPVNPKLSSRLKRALLATLLAVLVLATLSAAVSAYLEASDIQDEMLLSVAKLVETDQMGTTDPANWLDDDDLDDSAVSVWEIGRSNRKGMSIKKNLKTGFHTLLENDDIWRVYVTQQNRSKKRYVVAQKFSVSTEIALKSARNTAIPLLLLFLLIPLLITLIVRHSFKPLNRLSDKMADSDSLTLDLASETEIPVEVLPFVSAIDSLLEKNQAYNSRQRRFIADAAHELRTPITALTLEIENVQSAKSATIKNERQAALVKSVSRLQRLVNQLLDLARAQSIMEDKQSVVSLNELVKLQIADLYPLVEEKSIDISVNRNEPVQVADINNQLQHLIRNALSNAIKFTPDAGTIDIDLYRENDEAVFRVTDSGPGVVTDDLSKLHEPFYRADGQASGKGAGLGLAICHEVATLLQGQLTLDNICPNGFSFCYKQPLV